MGHDLRDAIVVCSACGKSRRVFRNHARKVARGLCSARCRACFHQSLRHAPEGGGVPKGCTVAAPSPAKSSCAATPICQHCRRNKVNRPRGLCWRDYYTPGVKELYPSTSKYARRGVGNFAGAAAPCEPTDALPGTPEKVAVLERRAALRQEIHHPLDARYSLGDSPILDALALPELQPEDPCELEEVA